MKYLDAEPPALVSDVREPARVTPRAVEGNGR
jgi:hypothetical protein